MGQTLREAILAADIIPPGEYENADKSVQVLAEPHRFCLAECDTCTHQWIVVYPAEGTVPEGWECPNCGSLAGRPYEKPDWE